MISARNLSDRNGIEEERPIERNTPLTDAVIEDAAEDIVTRLRPVIFQ